MRNCVCSNAGGSLIVDMALNFWREGKKREDIRMNSNELETKISLNIFNEEGIERALNSFVIYLFLNYICLVTLYVQCVPLCFTGGFQHSSLIDHHLVDHYIPFLPMELKHVRKCVLAEIAHLKIQRFHDLVFGVVREMPFFPQKERIFAVKGCKSVRQKLVIYTDN